MSGPAKKPKDGLMLRVLSAAFMVPAGLSVVWFGGNVLLIVGMLVAIGMWSEWWSVVTKTQISFLWGLAGLVLCLSVYLLCKVQINPLLTLMGQGSIFFIIFASRGVRQAVWLTLGGLLVAGAVSGLILVRGDTFHNLLLALIVMINVWISDIAAYFAGKGFGGPRLSPQGSPNKTWSGATGAVICTALVGALTAGLVGSSVINWLLFSGLISFVGQFGDLGESYWKRHFNVKDSGSLIPGHGGLLDRLDSFTAVLICLAILLLISPDFPIAFLGLESR
jgi:phosphatidate cytidylyltransferase